MLAGRGNGQTVVAKPYVERINWTAGIDQKTGKPVDYDPNRDIQVYSGRQNYTLAEPTKRLCPSLAGGNNYFPPSYEKAFRDFFNSIGQTRPPQRRAEARVDRPVRHGEGKGPAEIAAALGVSRMSVWRALNG
jgi:hypothetical protein